jgi:hypothetical protein
MDYCDADNNGQVNACEIHDCVVACENQWRTENCPEYGYLYCDMPFVCAECEGAWSCEDIENITIDILAYYDTSIDGSINPEDAIEADHYEVLVEYCDFNNDGSINACELHTCVVMCENAWREENCPEYGAAYCECPFYVEVCPGAMSCADIVYVTDEAFNYMNSNGDSSISLSDDVAPEHLDLLMEYCDTNGDE